MLSSCVMSFAKWRGKAILREPLVHFLIAGGLLVAAQRLYAHFSKPVIEVTSGWADTLARDYEVQTGHLPDPIERKEMIRMYVENEIIFREAKKQGLIDDPRVRNLMTLIQRESMEPVVADPTDAELEKMRQAEPEAFHFPAEISFEHESFPSEMDIPVGALERLQAGGMPMTSAAIRLPNPMPKTWMPQIEKMFGKDFSHAISEVKRGLWMGPIKSSMGMHFVKVLEYKPSCEMPMNQVRSALVSRWVADRKKAAVTDQAIELSKEYKIILPTEP